MTASSMIICETPATISCSVLPIETRAVFAWQHCTKFLMDATKDDITVAFSRNTAIVICLRLVVALQGTMVQLQ